MGAIWLIVTRVISFAFTTFPRLTIIVPVLPSIGEVMAGYFQGDFPASTWVEIGRLVDPRLKLEMSAIAVVPTREAAR